MYISQLRFIFLLLKAIDEFLHLLRWGYTTFWTFGVGHVVNLPQYAMLFGWAILSLKKVINLQRSFSHIQLPRLPVRSRRANRFPICKENHIPFRFLVWNQNVSKQPAWVKRFSIFHNISEKWILNVVRQQSTVHSPNVVVHIFHHPAKMGGGPHKNT